jgi:large subunit ribosomal protein L35
MKKLKTKSSIKKRVKITANGKIKRKHSFKNHILTKKSTKQKRRLAKFGFINKSDKKNIKKQLILFFLVSFFISIL